MAGYAAVLGAAVASRLSLSLLPVEYASSAQRTAWSWSVFAIFVAGFVAAALFAERARLPAPAAAWASPRASLGPA